MTIAYRLTSRSMHDYMHSVRPDWVVSARKAFQPPETGFTMLDKHSSWPDNGLFTSKIIAQGTLFASVLPPYLASIIVLASALMNRSQFGGVGVMPQGHGSKLWVTSKVECKRRV